MPVISPEERCDERVSYDTWGHSSRCSRKAVVKRDGKQYCKQHDPVEVAEKRRLRDIASQEKWKEDERQWELRTLSIKAITSAAEILGIAPLDLARQLQDGKIAKLIRFQERL